MDPFGLHPCRYEPAEATGSALAALLDALRATRLNGAAVAGRVRAVGVSEPDLWFRTGSVVDADTSVRDLLTSGAVREVLPDLLVPEPWPLAAPPRFAREPGDALSLDGTLASILVAGGAYGRFPGSAAEAKRLASAAVHDLVEDRYEDVALYVSWEAWSPYFRGVAWDATFLVVDRRDLAVTVLATTDAD